MFVGRGPPGGSRPGSLRQRGLEELAVTDLLNRDEATAQVLEAPALGVVVLLGRATT